MKDCVPSLTYLITGHQSLFLYLCISVCVRLFCSFFLKAKPSVSFHIKVKWSQKDVFRSFLPLFSCGFHPFSSFPSPSLHLYISLALREVCLLLLLGTAPLHLSIKTKGLASFWGEKMLIWTSWPSLTHTPVLKWEEVGVGKGERSERYSGGSYYHNSCTVCPYTIL